MERGRRRERAWARAVSTGVASSSGRLVCVRLLEAQESMKMWTAVGSGQKMVVVAGHGELGRAHEAVGSRKVKVPPPTGADVRGPGVGHRLSRRGRHERSPVRYIR